MFIWYLALKCPAYDQRRTMVDFTRIRFRDNQSIDRRDFDKISKMITRGEEELESMNYYHSGMQY